MATLLGNPRRERSARWMLACFYVILVIGGVTMIYPFWMMLTGSISDGLDFKSRSIIPLYLCNRDELFLKFLARRYAIDPALLFNIYPDDNVVRPIDYRGRLHAPVNKAPKAMIEDWHQFLLQANPAYLTIADIGHVLPDYQAFVEKRFAGDVSGRGTDRAAWQALAPIDRMNLAYHQVEIAFAFVQMPSWKFGQTVPADGEPVYKDYLDFLRTVSCEDLVPVSGESAWRDFLSENMEPSNLKHVPPGFPPAKMEDPTMRGLWESFLKKYWPHSLVRDGALICPETDWRNFLRAKYRTDTRLAVAWNDPSAKIDTVPLLYRAEDADLFIGNEWHLRWQMASENYAQVFQFLLHQGRALQNTVILVGMSILVALVFNPLAAYGLSRYPGRYGRMTLLLMVLTIAFPAEVAMIPSFLLLRDLNLLNTFAALILPGAVSGFSVFLLKGFFDGLPEELFESARIDGASDWELFWNVALPLSSPILAVTALGTFTAAYGGYMWALLVCQDSRMWTLMVWLFQFQMNYSMYPWLGMAAFMIASVPTLLVFVFCQRIILQGIIIPTEK